MRYLFLTVDSLIINTSGQQSDAEQQVEHLLRYVVATCYPKILRCLTNQLSQLYFLSLLSLQESTISFQKPENCHTPMSMELVSDCHLTHFIISLTLPIHEYRHSGELSSQRKGHLPLHWTHNKTVSQSVVSFSPSSRTVSTTWSQGTAKSLHQRPYSVSLKIVWAMSWCVGMDSRPWLTATHESVSSRQLSHGMGVFKKRTL